FSAIHRTTYLGQLWWSHQKHKIDAPNGSSGSPGTAGCPAVIPAVSLLGEHPPWASFDGVRRPVTSAYGRCESTAGGKRGPAPPDARRSSVSSARLRAELRQLIYFQSPTDR
ncbi:MAG: hypothetical protein QOE41_3416, partial [Mycobacterium sp.]|nr:hypothetical protein [Mycobacterium sp.]